MAKKTQEQIESLFPMKVVLTKSIVEKGTKAIVGPGKCIGSLLLQKGLRKGGLTKGQLDKGQARWMWLSGKLYVNTEIGCVSCAHISLESFDDNGHPLDIMDYGFEPIKDFKSVTVTFQIA
jgi:hypothetical protein